VYVGAADSKGAPITDLKAAELTVKEDGQDRAIASLQEATGPMSIAIIDDDDGSGFYQAGVLQFIQAIGEKADYAIRQFNPSPVKILDYTGDFNLIQDALLKLSGRGKVMGEGEQVDNAISESAKELQQKPGRRVILALTVSGDMRAVGGSSSGSKNPDILMNTLASTGAMLNVMYRSTALIGVVLGDGPRQSGGTIEKVGSTNAVPAGMTHISDLLLHQYTLTYTLPDGVKPSDRVNISTSRKGITLYAPSRIPDK
jgi:ribosomal protein S16